MLAELPLKFTVPVLAVNAPPVPRLPPIFSVPAPVKVNLATVAAPTNAMLPLTLIVPVETLTSEVLGAKPEVMVMLAAFNVPVPTAICLITFAVGAAIVMAPFTVNELVPLIERLFAVVPVLIAIESHVEGTSTVTLMFVLIVTASPLTGTDAPPQVVVSLQFPETEAVLAAA